MTVATTAIAASVALVVAMLTPAVTSLRGRREAISAKFDAAESALLLVQAARHIAASIEQCYHPGTDDEYRRFNIAMAERSILHFVDQTVEARAALAAISRYVPERRAWITTGWELTQEREPQQRRLIEAGRASALKTERLLRQSKSPADMSTETKA